MQADTKASPSDVSPCHAQCASIQRSKPVLLPCPLAVTRSQILSPDPGLYLYASAAGAELMIFFRAKVLEFRDLAFLVERQQRKAPLDSLARATTASR